MKEKAVQGGWFGRIRKMSEFNLILIWLVFMAVLMVIEPKFISVHNVTNLLRQTSITGVLAVGMTFVIISAGIDLSVGSVLAFSGMLAAMLMRDGLPIFPAMLIALGTSTLLGMVMGLLIYKGKIPPFIATLGGMQIIRGTVMLMSNANKILVSDSFGSFATAKFLGIPAMVYVWLAIVVIGFIISRYTIFGRNIYAIGSNEESARLSGIRVGRNICGIYAFCAFCSGVAGLLMTTRLGSGTPTAGTGMEMDAVAAAVVGGASLSGASGSVFGTVLGTLIIAMIRNSGQLLGINSFVLDIAVGGLIVIAVLIDQMAKNKKK